LNDCGAALYGSRGVSISNRRSVPRRINTKPPSGGAQLGNPAALKDAPVIKAMHELAAQYLRYGYRRIIQMFLERQGQVMSADRDHRIWRHAGLQAPKKRPRRRVAYGRPRPLPASGANGVWAYDFVFDACANGQQLKCLTVIDEYTRECLAIDVARPHSFKPRDRSAEQAGQRPWRTEIPAVR
jgi:transposase InsO family protein